VAFPHHITGAGAHLYFFAFTGKDHTIFRAPKVAGSSAVPLAGFSSGYSGDLAIGGSWVYVVAAKRLYRLPL
jgi:hypothetical protein